MRRVHPDAHFKKIKSAGPNEKFRLASSAFKIFPEGVLQGVSVNCVTLLQNNNMEIDFGVSEKHGLVAVAVADVVSVSQKYRLNSCDIWAGPDPTPLNPAHGQIWPEYTSNELEHYSQITTPGQAFKVIENEVQLQLAKLARWVILPSGYNIEQFETPSMLQLDVNRNVI